MNRTAVTLALAALTSTSCINVAYIRSRANEPVPAEVTDELVARAASLGDVIGQLGAPAIVWPSLNGRVVMAYAWLDSAEWGVSFSYSFGRFLPDASLRWDSEHSEVPAIVLEFDPELRLRIVRRGLLRDIAPEPVESTPSSLEVLRTYR